MQQNDKDSISKETGHKLLDACLDILEDKTDDSKLREAIRKAASELENMRKDFETTVMEQQQSITNICYKEIEHTRTCFNAYKEAIEVLETYLKTHDKFDIVRGAEKVRGCTTMLNSALFSFRDGILIAMGPTDIPILNLVLNTHKKLLELAINDSSSDSDLLAYGQKLLTVIYREHYTISKTLDEMKNQKLIHEEEMLQNAYEEHQRICITLRDKTKEFDYENLENDIEAYSLIVKKIRELIPIVNIKRMTQAPTSSPQANLVINLAKTLKTYAGDEEMFIDSLKTLEDNYNNIKMQFEAVKRNPTDSMVVKEEMDVAEKALISYENSISSFYRFIETREAFTLDYAINKLIDATKEIQTVKETFQSIAEREGKTPCIRCSHYNPPDRKTCEKCGAVLPVSAESQTGRTFELEEQDQEKPKDEEIVLTENIYRLFDDVNKVSEGQISIEEFEATVNWMEGLVIDGRKAYGPLPALNVDNMKPDMKEQALQIKEMLEEAKEVFREGTDDLLTGLNFFKQYSQHGDKNNLVTGVQIIWQGVAKLQKVQKATEVLNKAQQELQVK